MKVSIDKISAGIYDGKRLYTCAYIRNKIGKNPQLNIRPCEISINPHNQACVYSFINEDNTLSKPHTITPSLTIFDNYDECADYYNNLLEDFQNRVNKRIALVYRELDYLKDLVNQINEERIF